MEKPIVLIGMMGSGKTTIGKKMSGMADLPWIDTDQWIEEKEGKTIPEIFLGQGEKAFRKLETNALRETLKTYPLIATGGGIVVTEENRKLLQQDGFIVYLQTSLEILAKRTAGTDRPLLKNNANALAQIYEARKSLYESCADLVIATDHLSAEEIGARILKAARTSS